MENLKAKSFDLRKDTVDIIVAGKVAISAVI